MDTIVKAIPLDDYLIEVATSSGISGIFDVKPYLGVGAFQELRNLSYFSLVRPAHHGIAWPNEQDFSSDTIIYDIKNAQRIRLDRASAASHDLNRLLDKPGPQRRESAAQKIAFWEGA